MRLAQTPNLLEGKLTLDENACYWAIITPGIARPSAEALRYAFEPHLPAPLDEIETRFAKFDGQTWLACGVERLRLDTIISDTPDPLDSILPSLPPESLRVALGLDDPDRLSNALSRLEFRSGAYESPGAARWKKLSAASLALALIGASLLLSLGAWRHASTQDQTTAQAVAASRELAASVTGSNLSGSVDPRLRLTAQLRALERTRDASSSDLLSTDRSSDFVSLLAAIPPDLPVSIDSLEVDQDSITLRGRVREPGDYETLTFALSNLSPDWSSPTGSVSQAREGYTFTIAIKTQEGSG